MPKSAPDWYSSMAMHGKHGVNYVTVAVDAAGNILSLMQGDFGGVPATIAVDAAGNMKANLVVQDLDRVVMRASLGTPVKADLTHVFLGIGSFDVVDIAGKGIILGGCLIHPTAVSHRLCTMAMQIDGVEFGAIRFEDLMSINATDEFIYPFRLVHYDDEWSFYYVMSFNPGWTFDTSLKITISENVGAAQFAGYLYYTLV